MGNKVPRQIRYSFGVMQGQSRGWNIFVKLIGSDASRSGIY